MIASKVQNDPEQLILFGHLLQRIKLLFVLCERKKSARNDTPQFKEGRNSGNNKNLLLLLLDPTKFTTLVNFSDLVVLGHQHPVNLGRFRRWELLRDH